MPIVTCSWNITRIALECTLEYYEILHSRFALEHRYAAKKDKTKASTPQLRYLNHVHAAKLLETGGKVECSSEISGLLQKALIELETLRGTWCFLIIFLKYFTVIHVSIYGVA